jgi:hypothetical protein
MRLQVLILTGAAALFVVGGYFLMRGVQHDELQQDVRAAQLATDVKKVADSNVVVAEATEKLSGAVGQLSTEATRSDARLDNLEDRVEEVEDYIPTRKAAVAGAFIASDFQIATMAKVAIAEALMTNGVAPNSNTEAGLAAPTDLHGQSLRAVHVRQGGEIEVVYDQQSGVDGGSIRLIPDLELALRSGVINWRCETDDYPEIAKFMPACHYVGSL